jgi:hypothetical protein
MLGLENAQKPVVQRKRWTDEEEIQLLTLLRKKKTIEEIAALHGRTATAINLKRQSLAAEYHFNEGRSNQDIQKLMGMTPTEVDKAIAKHSAAAAAAAAVTSSVQEQQQQQQQQQQPLDLTVPLPPSPPDQQNYVAVAQEQQQEQEQEPTMKEMMALLLNMQKTVKILVPDEPSMRDLMKVVTDIQKRLDTLIATVQ